MEFLPAWYPQIHNRKRQVMLQAWGTLVLLGGLVAWMYLSGRNVKSAEVDLRALSGQISQTEAELQKLDDLLNLQKQLRQQDRINAKLGLHVEATRMITALENSMPREMAVLSLGMEIEEQARPVATLDDAKAAQDKTPPVTRKLKIKMQGVAPTDVDVANFLARLGTTPYFENVAMGYARDRLDTGHVMREFEVTFAVDLTTPPGAMAAGF
jgi:Tfp pilus assembly protein PilN